MLMANAFSDNQHHLRYPPCKSPDQAEELHEAHATTDVDDQNLRAAIPSFLCCFSPYIYTARIIGWDSDFFMNS